MKRAGFFALGLAAIIWITACGYKKPPSNKTPVSKIAQRVFISNQTTNVLQIVDAKKDALSNFFITAGFGPTTLVETPDKAGTVVYNATIPSVSLVVNSTETATSSGVSLPGPATSLVVSSDARFAYAAVPSAPPNSACGSSSVLGAIEVVDLTNNVVSNCLALTGVRHLVLSHNNSTLLAFVDNSNVAYGVNTASLTTLPVPLTDVAAQLDMPVGAIFSSDDSTAFILSCGQECGGTTAKVSALAVSTKTVGTTVAVSAAREAFLDGSTLYVAGTVPPAGVNPASGMVSVLSTNPLAVTKTAAITDGLHDTITLSNGQLFVGARGCSDTAQGCLSMLNVSSGAVKYSAVNPSGDDITGMEPIPGRTVVYVCEGGELRIYDTTTDALQKAQLDIVGNAVDVREVF